MVHIEYEEVFIPGKSETPCQVVEAGKLYTLRGSIDSAHLDKYVEYLADQYPEVLVRGEISSPSSDVHHFKPVYTNGERIGEELPPFFEWLRSKH